VTVRGVSTDVQAWKVLALPVASHALSEQLLLALLCTQTPAHFAVHCCCCSGTLTPTLLGLTSRAWWRTSRQHQTVASCCCTVSQRSDNTVLQRIVWYDMCLLDRASSVFLAACHIKLRACACIMVYPAVQGDTNVGHVGAAVYLQAAHTTPLAWTQPLSR
jgi:hypothetical protein